MTLNATCGYQNPKHAGSHEPTVCSQLLKEMKRVLDHPWFNLLRLKKESLKPS